MSSSKIKVQVRIPEEALATPSEALVKVLEPLFDQYGPNPAVWPTDPQPGDFETDHITWSYELETGESDE